MDRSTYLSISSALTALAALILVYRVAGTAGTEFLVIPSKVMRNLTGNYDELRKMFQAAMIDRLSMIDQPRGVGMDQELLRELRTNQPDMETEPNSAEVTV